jgi:hypothetical protein
MPGQNGTLKAREFVFFCEDLALASLPATVPKPERRVMWTILQLHYGDPRVHFELQPQVARGVVELGLHFEGPVELNDRWAALVAERATEIAAALGDGWELEEWTASWRRLHRTWPFATLTAELGREVASQLATAIEVLYPVLDAGREMMGGMSEAVPGRTSGGEHGGRWRRSKARRQER